jgi:hypothetical protein
MTIKRRFGQIRHTRQISAPGEASMLPERRQAAVIAQRRRRYAIGRHAAA